MTPTPIRTTTTVEEPSVGELFGDLSRQLGALVRQEARLAGTELRAKASNAGRELGLVAAGGALAYAGLLVLLAALVMLLDLVLPLWLSALLVGLVVAGAGYALIRRGLDALKQQDLQPRTALRSIREDVTLIKEAA